MTKKSKHTWTWAREDLIELTYTCTYAVLNGLAIGYLLSARGLVTGITWMIMAMMVMGFTWTDEE